MNLLITNGRVLSDKIIVNGAIAIENNKIIDIGESATLKKKYRRYEKIDATDHFVLPGLINTHTHAAMTLLRGYADDLNLNHFLEKVWTIEKYMTGQDIEVGAELAAIESIMSGVTTLNSMYFYHEDKNEATAFKKINIRGIIGIAFFTHTQSESKKKFLHAVNKWHGANNDTIRIAMCPHAPYTVDPNLLKEIEFLRIKEEKRVNGPPIIVSSHIAELKDEANQINQKFQTKVKKNSIIKYLDSLNILSNRFLAAHMVNLNTQDIDIASKRKIHVSHNPISNFKLNNGLSPVSKMLSKGIPVSLGTDGPASNNSLDMIETMKFTALIHKYDTSDPTQLSAKQVFDMATKNGATSLNWHNLGQLKKDHIADIVLLNYKKPHLSPLSDEYSHLVYAAKSSDISTVIIDGKIVLEDRLPPKINLDKIIEKAIKTKDKLLSKIENNDK